MYRTFVFTTTNAPGLANTINLQGAAPGRVPYTAVFASGALVFYFIDDGAQAEWGIGTLTYGVPATLARTTVIGNTLGNQSRVNFPGMCNIYCQVPAENAAWLDPNLVAQFPGGAAIRSVGGGQIAGLRNVVINGEMAISERALTFSNMTSGQFTLDRWQCNHDGSGATTSIRRNTISLSDATYAPFLAAGFAYTLEYTVTAPGTANSLRQFQQKIEGVRTFAGQRVTLSAMMQAASPMTVGAYLTQNFGTGGSPSTSTLTPQINLSIGTVAQRYVFTFNLPSVNGKTLGTNGDDWLGVVFNLPAGVNLTWKVTGIQLEPGSVATPFEFLPIALQIRQCQRYFLVMPCRARSTPPTNFGFPIPMRVSPTAGFNGGSIAGIAYTALNARFAAFTVTTGADATGANALTFSAEL